MLFRLAAATGMRRGELVGLRWSDVHLDTGRLEITQALTAIGYEISFSRLKTKTSRRCISLDPTPPPT
jgi:integrase